LAENGTLLLVQHYLWVQMNLFLDKIMVWMRILLFLPVEFSLLERTGVQRF
jgi:hypothetical protein